jgi:acetyltransferase-like isoleucine patch superfamily enzyme
VFLRVPEARHPLVSAAPREHDPRITVIQRELFDEKRSKLERYADLVVGRPGLWALFKFEAIVTLTSWVPGALGLLLRSKLYPLLMGRCGRNVTFGVNVVLRHPHKIAVGDNVVIDDNCCLDAKGTDNTGITIGNGVFVGRNTILSCKNGDIVLDDQANIGFNVEIFAASRVRVGRKVLIAAYCYLVGGDHLYDRIDVPVLEQGRTARGIEIDDHAWLGAHAVVTDGSRVGKDCIIGAGAIVIGQVPDFAIAAGVPAKVLRNRLDGVSAEESARGAGAVAPGL